MRSSSIQQMVCVRKREFLRSFLNNGDDLRFLLLALEYKWVRGHILEIKAVSFKI